MKKTLIILVCIFAAIFSVKAQISMSHPAEKVEHEDTSLSYDITKNYLGNKNVKSYIGQILYVNGRSKTVQGYGYDNFKREKEPQPYSKNDRYGKKSEKSPYNTKYEDLFGKYFIVLDVLPDSKQKTSSLYENEWWFKLQNQNDPSDIVWFNYDGKYEHTFPFIVMSYYNNLQATIKGKKFISSYREKEDGITTFVNSTDFLTGKPIVQSPNDVWTAESITIEDCNYDLIIIVKNQKGETSTIKATYYDNDRCSDGKMNIVTEEKYDELIKKYGKNNIEKVRKGVITVGMPKDCVILSWGNPNEINRSSYGSDQWVYDGQYVYIEDGVVTAWN